MGVTGENLAEKYELTREEVDSFAMQSQQRRDAANKAGHFKDEIAPIEIKTKKGPKSFDTDEHPKPQTTIEQMAKLPPVFKKGGVVTAASASGICDGAAAVIVASEEAVKENGFVPLARIVGYGISGCKPTGINLADVEQIEINEAFGAQTLACAKELEINEALGAQTL